MYSLRPATHADYDYLFQLHCDTIRPYVEATWGWDDAEQQERWQNHFDPTGRQIIQLLTTAGTLTDVGTLELTRYPDHWYLDLIEIAPAYQNQGLGAIILSDLIRQAHAAGLPLTLSVLKANTPARRLYERLGFVITAEEDVRYQMALRPEMNNETMNNS
jgi:ribosomal protein S18 acetylase RimI-like enzyme